MMIIKPYIICICDLFWFLIHLDYLEIGGAYDVG